ncbi:hypothetical protein OHA18_38620 [Kribbella sp. NBC_00709]|uniref:hypothetical protein n=1 Tax=Kribbella sp. NBC_00709 TaxID=2975972 RepID=UPI002E2E7D3D|nr:hypothetical protein [Kribbella sp. NBC_00709]
MAVIRDPAGFAEWMVAVPPALRVGPNWPDAGCVVERDTGREIRGRHMHNRHLVVAVVDSWRPDHELVVRLRSGLGGWVQIAVKVQPRPGGALIEVRAEPLTASARVRYVGAGRNSAEQRCAEVAERLIALATTDDPDD